MQNRPGSFVILATLLSLLAVGTAAAQQATVPLTASQSPSLLVKLVPGLSPVEEAAVIFRNGGTEIAAVPALRLHVIAVAPADVATLLARYLSDPAVERAEENKTRVWETVPADPLYPAQWALPKIGWDTVFGAITPQGTARVAILDTGIDGRHPDLAGNVIPGISILDGSDGLMDPTGHGTWLAGIVAARTDSALEGIAGIAFAGVQVMPVTVLNGTGEGLDSDVIAGVIWAADHGADIILMAFSNPGFSPNLQDAIDYAWSKGVVLIAAVGNSAVSDPTFPAGDRGVMGVAATDASEGLAYFSNDGQAVFIAAPGVDIATTDIANAYVTVSGTSTSAAMVAGAAALMKAVDPTLTNGIIVGRLARNADPAGMPSQTGNGRINLPRALADTSTEFIQPAGAAPVGDGGPFVGPYRAASTKVTSITLSPTSRTITYGTASVLYTVTINSRGNGTVSLGTSGLPGGATASFAPSSPVTCSGGGGNPCPSVTMTLQTSTVVASASAYSFTVNAQGDGDTSPTSSNGQLTVNKADQTINFTALGDKTYGDADFTVSATTTSGLAVTFGSQTMATCAVSGSTVHIVAVGTCTIRASQPGSVNYNAAPTVDQSFTIAKRAAFVTPNAANKAYGDADPSPLTTGTLAGFLAADTVTATYTRTPGETVAGSPYTVSATLSPAGVLGNYDITYNTASFTIDKRTASVTPNTASKTYGDADPSPLTTGILTGFLTADAVTATYSRAAGETVAGSPYTISAVLAPAAVLGNYAITSNTADFTINKRVASVTPAAASKAYGDADPSPLTTGTLTGFLATDGVTAIYTRTAGETVAGSPYTISATLSPMAVLDNYDITSNTALFTITKRPASVTPAAASKTYGDADPAFTGALSGFLAADGVTATYSRTAGETVAGSPYTISATLAPVAVLGNYDITSNTADFTIDKRSASVTPAAASKTYGDADPTLTGTLTGFVPADGVSAAYSRTAGETVAASPYTISAILAPAAVLGNYDITSNTASFTINRRPASVTPAAASKAYGDADPSPLTTGTLTGFLAADGVTATYSRTAGETVAASPYTISAALAPAAVLGNYDITSHTASFTINRRPASVTPAAASKTYGDADPALTGTLIGFMPADGVSAAYSRTAGETVVGSPYTISATLSPAGALGNYNITSNTASFTIDKRTASVTPNAASKTYGDADPSPLTTGILTGFLAGDAVTATYSRTAGETVAGSPYTISGALAPAAVLGNYAITSNTANFTINKRAASVTPAAASKTYGDADPALTGTLTGFVLADGVSAVYSRTAGETVVGSPYTIRAALSPAAVLSNYYITYNTANFTVTKATLTVTADNKSKILNATNPPFTATISGFQNGEMLVTSGVTGSPSLTSSATATSPVGSYPITASPGTLSATNYTFTFVSGTLSIMYAPVGLACYGDAGHQILQPINANGTSVFKQRSTVPAKFRVCDVNGNSIGTPGVVTSFVRYYSSSGTVLEIDEVVDSTTPDTAFRWSSGDQQWIFNISTKTLSANMTYYYRITVNDGSTIEFQYGLK